MTEFSLPWAGEVTGDKGPYSDDQWSDTWRKLFCRDRTKEGVLAGYANELAVSGATSPLSVATGAAVVDGKFYEADASVSVAVPTPSTATRKDYIVLRKSWSAQTVRATRIEGTEGGGEPSLVQTDGTTWDIPLALATITTGGVITLEDRRYFCASPLGPLFAAGPKTLTIASGVVIVDHRTHYKIDTEGAASTDDLDTINGGYTGQVIILQMANSAREPRLRDGIGNLALALNYDFWLIDTDRYIMLMYDGSNWVELFPGSQRITAIEFLIDAGGGTLPVKEYTSINIDIGFDFHIMAGRLEADQSGSIVVDLWADTWANYPPTNADSICASAKLTLSSAIKVEDTTLTGWTRRLRKGSTMRPEVESATTITAVTVSLPGTRL